MKVRRLDRLIQFQRASVTDAGFGPVEGEFANHGAPVWAERSDVSDGEKSRAGIVEASLMSRFKIRYSDFAADLTPADRLVTEGVTMNITGIKEITETGGRRLRREWLEISATARAS
ncbi:MAG: head-tail adaptor protein [Loktanella sp.]|nr:head-tail adaptor protein [Loktanella sp.]